MPRFAFCDNGAIKTRLIAIILYARGCNSAFVGVSKSHQGGIEPRENGTGAKNMTKDTLSLVACRDYSVGALASDYEYVIYRGEEIVARKGGFKSSTAAKRAGLKAAQTL